MLSVRRPVITALGLLLILSACGGKGASNGGAGAAASPKVLNLYIWSDYLAPNTLADFEQQTGIKVHVAYYDTNETLRPSCWRAAAAMMSWCPRPRTSRG